MYVNLLCVRPEQHVKLLPFGQIYKGSFESAWVSLLENGLAFSHLGGALRDQASLSFRYQLLFYIDRGDFCGDVARSDLIG